MTAGITWRCSSSVCARAVVRYLCLHVHARALMCAQECMRAPFASAILWCWNGRWHDWALERLIKRYGNGRWHGWALERLINRQISFDTCVRPFWSVCVSVDACMSARSGEYGCCAARVFAVTGEQRLPYRCAVLWIE